MGDAQKRVGGAAMTLERIGLPGAGVIVARLHDLLAAPC